ncbi:Mor transcription activator family protein [Tepidibacillus decaturensis]|uniref:Mor transcription activator domain-containing protein n=1 Tax=Tepidibacillus decaturensis TaxID=1413211 RepID=A0A135L136_9BACI|nr:Mor transcription activator family protein [Tepidibacillus decaturensis]KXG42655.1 hypothetical protein U473_00285 [Tepidibacillus decaturensis]
MPKSVSFAEIKPIIGEEAALRLIDKYADSQVYIPNKMPEFPNPETRNEYIRNLSYSGKSIQELAEQFDLSKGYIYKILAGKN